MELKMNYLLDTNILIYYFNGSLLPETKNILTNMMQNSFNISVISKMEFLGFNRFDSKERAKAEMFISYTNIISLNDHIVEKVINVRQNRKMKLPDAIIAATSMQHNMELVTHNTKDFKELDINIIDPFVEKM